MDPPTFPCQRFYADDGPPGLPPGRDFRPNSSAWPGY